MTYICIRNKRIRDLSRLSSMDFNKLEVAIPSTDEEAQRVGLKEVGDSVVPSGEFGKVSRVNAYGETYADRTKPKVRTYVSTNWIYPYGNDKASRFRWIFIEIVILEFEFRQMKLNWFCVQISRENSLSRWI